jgi:glucoamylase
MPAVAVLAAGIALSGGTSTDPPVPHGFPGVVPTFLVGTEGAGDAHGGDGKSSERAAIRRDRRWLTRSAPLGDGAPRWARRLYRRSLLVLRALVDPRSGAAVAGARAGWGYVWPRDAAAAAIALASAGYQDEARRIVRFLLGLDLDAAARFDRQGDPVDGRAAQGDAVGWVTAAARDAGIELEPVEGEGRQAEPRLAQSDWRGLADYQEKDGGDYLGNAIASGVSSDAPFESPRGLTRVAEDPGSGLDSAAAWAVRPFPLPALYPAARRTLLHLVTQRDSRFGIVPSEDWNGGDDPWTAPTAWSAWSLATLARIDWRAGRRRGAAIDRTAALRLLGDLRRAATPAGLLPERVDARTGRPTSTTPLAWSHAFAILAIRELWPARH